MVRKLQIDRNVNIKQNQKQQQEHRKSMLETLRASCWVRIFLGAKMGTKDIQGITYNVKGCQGCQ
jgi:hypothetical protein